jgi:hypothetical protein
MAAGSLARWLLDSLSSRHATDVEDDGLAGASVLVLHASVRLRPGAAWEGHTKVVPTDSVASPVLKGRGAVHTPGLRGPGHTAATPLALTLLVALAGWASRQGRLVNILSGTTGTAQ